MLGRPDFRVDGRVRRRGLLENGYDELAISGDHAVAVLNLPPLHKDPSAVCLLRKQWLRALCSSPPTPRSANIPDRSGRCECFGDYLFGWHPAVLESLARGLAR